MTFNSEGCQAFSHLLKVAAGGLVLRSLTCRFDSVSGASEVSK